MKITVTETPSIIKLEDVHNEILLETSAGEQMFISMRDSGFEFKYQDKLYFAKEGCVEPFHTLEKGDHVLLPFGEKGIIVEIRELIWGFPYIVKITHSTGWNAKGSKADYRVDELKFDTHYAKQ